MMVPVLPFTQETTPELDIARAVVIGLLQIVTERVLVPDANLSPNETDAIYAARAFVHGL